MDYLTQLPQQIAHCIPDSRESLTERAQQVTHVLDEILHQRTTTPENLTQLLRRRLRFKARALTRTFLLSSRVFLLFTDDRCDGLKFVAFTKFYHLHPLRISARFTDILNKSAHHLTSRRDDHDFIRIPHRQCSDHAPCL